MKNNLGIFDRVETLPFKMEHIKSVWKTFETIEFQSLEVLQKK